MNYSLKDVTKIISQNIILIFICMLVFGGAMGLQAKLKKQTTYTGSRQVYIMRQYDQANANEELMADINLMKTYNALIESQDVAKVARQQLPKKLQREYSVADLNSMVNASHKDMTLVSTIKVTAASPKEAKLITNAYARAVQRQLPKMAPTIGEVKLFAPVKEADIQSKTTPSAKKRVALGLAIGLLVGMLIAFTLTTWKHLI